KTEWGLAGGQNRKETPSKKAPVTKRERKHLKEIRPKKKPTRQAELAILLARLAQRPAEQFGVKALRSGTLRSRPAAGDRPVTVDFELVMNNLARKAPPESVIEQTY